MKRDARNKGEQLPNGSVIYLNDAPVRDCVVFDTDAGYVERWRTNEHGRIVYPPALIREYGAVRVEIPACAF
jgi:hypothetical protein